MAQLEPVDLPLALAMLTLHRDLIDHVQQLTWVLTSGDFEALVIWCELSRSSGDSAEAAALPLHDLVTATAIPRETVRRKLERLAKLGHVHRVGRGWAVCAGPLDLALRERAQASARLTRGALDSLAAPVPGTAADRSQHPPD